MHRSTAVVTTFAFATSAVLLLAACDNQRTPTDATRATTATALFSEHDSHTGGIVAHDACDPATFNAFFNDPTVCVKQGNTLFSDFIAEIPVTGSAKGWELTPGQLNAQFGVNLLGNNIGGETHTFTPVAKFGGGINDILNALSGNTEKAPECGQLDDDDKVKAGDKYTIEAEELAAVVDGDGIARVQCCIHPWMRSEVHLHGRAA